MAHTMLVNATDADGVRVAVLDGDTLESFRVSGAGFTRGNIYLGKVARVEPSLQAAFVDYGAERHGFLPFGDIHPDYYRIPLADRDSDRNEGAKRAAAHHRAATHNGDGEKTDGENLPHNRYLIQDVIQRNQVMLVQVVKEWRGHKGAGLTTRLSLAGRYCVLMPNNPRGGGGVSRRIDDEDERQRLSDILTRLDIPQGMSVILRTAGRGGGSLAAVKSDYDYLMGLWESLRERAVKASAPTLLHDDTDAVTQAVRDVFQEDMDEVVVDDKDHFDRIRELLAKLTSGQTRKLKLYDNPAAPLFEERGVEDKLLALYEPQHPLEGGGSLVVNVTEAMTVVDVNSGRATSRRTIEETALHINLAAADDVARLLRLCELSGLIVIDFIDMENANNRIRVETRLRQALRKDRARVQTGRISQFGLLEMSRQRLRPSLFEMAGDICPLCGGSGVVRNSALLVAHVMRRLRLHAETHRGQTMTLRATAKIASRLLNGERRALISLEDDYGVAIDVRIDDGVGAHEFLIGDASDGDTPPAAEEGGGRGFLRRERSHGAGGVRDQRRQGGRAPPPHGTHGSHGTHGAYGAEGRTPRRDLPRRAGAGFLRRFLPWQR